MIKTLNNIFKQDKEKFVVPKGVQDCIPVTAIYDDGIFRVGKDKYSKSFKFTDINYAVASREDKEAMFLEYSELLNSLDSGATTKLTINNRRLNRLDFEKTILIPETGDELDEYREEYNKMLLDKATGANSTVQDKYVTISINKKNVDDARTYFARVGADLISHFSRLGSKCVELETDERLRIIHDFFRVGEETSYHFDIKETRKKGHDFKDYICPDSLEFESNYFKIGNRYGRVIFLREYASYIKDSMVAELTDMNRNLMMSIDIVPVPTDEAVREAENRLLGVETNITNWQRKQNMKPCMISLINLAVLFVAKVADNALSTTKTILVQRSRWILAGIAVIISDFIYFWITKRVVSANNEIAMLVVAVAGGVGCSLACFINEKMSKDRTYVNVIMSDDLEEMKRLRDFLAQHHITNVASDSYTLDWNAKTISIIAYPETKAESRLINEYIADSSTKFKRVIQPA